MLLLWVKMMMRNTAVSDATTIHRLRAATRRKMARQKGALMGESAIAASAFPLPSARMSIPCQSLPAMMAVGIEPRR